MSDWQKRNSKELKLHDCVLYYRAVLYMDTNALGEPAASIFRVNVKVTLSLKMKATDFSKTYKTILNTTTQTPTINLYGMHPVVCHMKDI
jgi:hypothetical protein